MNTQKRFVESTSIELTHTDDWDEYVWQDGDQILIGLTTLNPELSCTS